MERINTLKPKMPWLIYILMDTTHKVPIIVGEDCLISELMEKIRADPRIPKGATYRLYTSDGLSIEDNQDSGKLHLSYYRLINKSTVNLSVGLQGGVWPTMEQLERQPRNPRPSARIQITDSDDHPDILGLDDDNPRVIMPCGHAIAPLSLALHCYQELENKKPGIRCPKCSSTWPFSLIREAACLTDEERTEFEQKLLRNQQNQAEVKQCPFCLVSCHRTLITENRAVCLNCRSKGNVNCTFCWNCLREWRGGETGACGNASCDGKTAIFEILAECKTIEVCGVQCPSLRACPKCFLIIEHLLGCKHMTCKRCSREFCFICLSMHIWTRDQSLAPCKVAPRQTSDTGCAWASARGRKEVRVRYPGLFGRIFENFFR